jgi:hypothetical protein
MLEPSWSSALLHSRTDLAFPRSSPLNDAERIRNQTQYRHGAHTLTAGALSQQTYTLTLIHMIGEPVRHLDNTFLGIEAGAKVSNCKEFPVICFRRLHTSALFVFVA